MDADSFEVLTRSLATVAPRRVALIGAFGTALTALLSRMEVEEVEAKRKKGKNKKRKKGKKNSATSPPVEPTSPPPPPADSPPPPDPPPPPPTCGAGGPCLVFVTSTTPQGNLGGLTGADALCQARAGAAGLPGAYKAWLSDTTGSPSTRFVQSSGPYQRVDGVTIANTFADLIDGALAAPISVTETGGVVSPPLETWTSTQFNGTLKNGGICDGWTDNTAIFTATLGSATSSNSSWTETNVTSFCSETRRLYCFQQS